MIRDLRNHKCHRGFALVVTLSLMILLTIIAVGLLSLSSIALRQSGVNSAQASARANAWLGLQLALAELQKNAGDDRRITANGSIINGTKQPEVMGVWKSWSPKLSKTPTASAPNYAAEKKNNFVRWMISGNEVDLTKPDWVTGLPSAVDQVKLFRQDSDGFLLQAAKIGVAARDGRRAFAWAVSQEATKAKLTVTYIKPTAASRCSKGQAIMWVGAARLRARALLRHPIRQWTVPARNRAFARWWTA
jgi:Tfp pilus assembly protein PilV